VLARVIMHIAPQCRCMAFARTQACMREHARVLQINELISQLEAKNPTPNPTEVRVGALTGRLTWGGCGSTDSCQV
jgi:hypothetical protein